ncbi:MAG: TIGR04086 family membrane protein [Ruminococcus sp.]|nr:TIGR04086 family membrane protein [Ruminococcus sp.]MDE7098833.1 TIGR04086 family membrane protein [Ruminococcus sp.]
MRRYRHSLWTNTLFSFAVPVLIGVLCMIVCGVIFSALTFFIFKSMVFLKVSTVVSLTAGGVISGKICGKYRRHRGLIDGTLCGVFLYVLIFSVGFAFGETTDIKKLLLLVVSGAIGGVIGVNSERPRNLM